MFGRSKRKSSQAEESATPTTETSSSAPDPETATDTPERTTGPFDESEVDGLDGRIDLGGIWLRPVQGMEVRLEVDQATEVVSAVQVSLDDATAQLQAFAAPRSSGIWDEIRAEIAEMIETNRGTAEESTGPFGTELLTRLPQPGPDGRTVFAPAIFVGVDGPRWFLRAVYSGRAAVDEQARRALDAVLAGSVVVRGADPMAPREMLPLHIPQGSS